MLYPGKSVSQCKIRCFRNSEKLRKPDGSKFRRVSARQFRRETCKMKMEALFRVCAALPLTYTRQLVSITFPQAVLYLHLLVFNPWFLI